MLELAPDLPLNVSGLVYPEAPGTSLDVLTRLTLAATRQRALQHLRNAQAANGDGCLFETATALLERLSEDAAARVFAHPLAQLDIPLSDTSDGCADARNAVARARALVRHMIHHPDVPETTFILTASHFSEGRIYLPHVHATLYSAGEAPVAVLSERRVTRFVWLDGMSVTLPKDGLRLPMTMKHPRLRPLPCVAGIPILNTVPEVRASFDHFDIAPEEETTSVTSRLEPAFDLLRRIWPEAHAAASRHLRALVPLKSREFSRSHSPRHLLGAVLMTADTLERIADLLCHELAHIRMHAVLDWDPIARADPAREAAGFVSPWRPDPRPLSGLLNGVHAFLNVCGFYRRLSAQAPNANFASLIYERQARKIRAAWTELQAHGQPTTFGRLVFDRFAAEVAAL